MPVKERQQLGEAAFREALESRRLTIHAAHVRYAISRESLTKMENGQPVGLEVVEKWARSIGEDVNRWRVLWGFPPVETAPDGQASTPEPARLDVIEQKVDRLAQLLVADRIGEQRGEYRTLGDGNADQVFIAGLRQLAGELNVPISVLVSDLPAPDATEVEVRERLNEVRERVVEEGRNKGRRDGPKQNALGGFTVPAVKPG